jgi:hypothetical protein
LQLLFSGLVCFHYLSLQVSNCSFYLKIFRHQGKPPSRKTPHKLIPFQLNHSDTRTLSTVYQSVFIPIPQYFINYYKLKIITKLVL